MNEHNVYIAILTIMAAIRVTSQAQAVSHSKSYFGGRCMKNQYGTYRVALQFCDGKNWRTHIPPAQATSALQGSNYTGSSCLDILNKGLSHGDGYYVIDPQGDNEARPLVVYCDMTSFGGGWTMCYTTDKFVNIKTELSTSPARGYRGDCNNIPFTSVMFLDRKSMAKAAFTKIGSAITFSGNYDKKADAYGLWTPEGVASKQYKYQLLICDTSFYKGLLISGYTNCYKECGQWCGDTKSPYFRTASSSSSYAGVAFNEPGAKVIPNRLISAGIR